MHYTLRLVGRRESMTPRRRGHIQLTQCTHISSTCMSYTARHIEKRHSPSHVAKSCRVSQKTHRITFDMDDRKFVIQYHSFFFVGHSIGYTLIDNDDDNDDHYFEVSSTFQRKKLKSNQVRFDWGIHLSVEDRISNLKSNKIIKNDNLISTRTSCVWRWAVQT